MDERMEPALAAPALAAAARRRAEPSDEDARMSAPAQAWPNGPTVLDLLGRLGYGGMLLGARGQVMARNDLAASWAGEWSPALPPAIRRTVDELAATARKATALPHRRGALILHVVRLPAAVGRERILLILIDPRARADVDEGMLRDIFRLTGAEAKLAIRLARGERPQAIAKARRVGLGTVRTQLRSIFAKTGTASQVELVLLLARLAIVGPVGT
jgi:DNA-binding CsgD family transcriptional regulator